MSESNLDLSQVDPEPAPPAPAPEAPAVDTRPRLILIWDAATQAPMIQSDNCLTFEMQIALVAVASNVIARRCEEARNNQAQVAMMAAMQNQAIAQQINNKHAPGLPPGLRRH